MTNDVPTREVEQALRVYSGRDAGGGRHHLRLAAILFPVFAVARADARRTACISNLHQIGLALSLYRQDYEGLPPHLSLITPTYLTDARVLVCPNDPNRGTYGGTLRLEGTLFLPTGVKLHVCAAMG